MTVVEGFHGIPMITEQSGFGNFIDPSGASVETEWPQMPLWDGCEDKE